MSERQHSELCGCDECEAHDEHERSLPEPNPMLSLLAYVRSMRKSGETHLKNVRASDTGSRPDRRKKYIENREAKVAKWQAWEAALIAATTPVVASERRTRIT